MLKRISLTISYYYHLYTYRQFRLETKKGHYFISPQAVDGFKISERGVHFIGTIISPIGKPIRKIFFIWLKDVIGITGV